MRSAWELPCTHPSITECAHRLMDWKMAIVFSATAVLFVGEIIPSAIFSGPHKLALSAYLVPVVRVAMILLSPVRASSGSRVPFLFPFPSCAWLACRLERSPGRADSERAAQIAWPLAKVLDCILGSPEGPSSRFNRLQLQTIIRLHQVPPRAMLASIAHRIVLVPRVEDCATSLQGDGEWVGACSQRKDATAARRFASSKQITWRRRRCPSICCYRRNRRSSIRTAGCAPQRYQITPFPA